MAPCWIICSGNPSLVWESASVQSEWQMAVCLSYGVDSSRELRLIELFTMIQTIYTMMSVVVNIGL